MSQKPVKPAGKERKYTPKPRPGPTVGTTKQKVKLGVRHDPNMGVGSEPHRERPVAPPRTVGRPMTPGHARAFAVELLNEHARVPTKANPMDAGYDLYSADQYQIKPGERVVVHTHIKVRFPEGLYGSIRPRSGWAVKYGIDILAGVVDNGYRGEIMVVLINHGESVFNIKIGDRVAQMILAPYATRDPLKVSSIEEIYGSTERREGGFGSSGR